MPTRLEYWRDRADSDRVHHRGAAYDAFKARLQERMLAEVLGQLPPAVAAAVRHVSLGTPLSNNTFLGTSWGEAYGLEHSARRFNQPFLRPSTPVGGLLLTGQDVLTDGVAGGALAAFLTASALDPLRVPRMLSGVLATMAATAT